MFHGGPIRPGREVMPAPAVRLRVTSMRSMSCSPAAGSCDSGDTPDLQRDGSHGLDVEAP